MGLLAVYGRVYCYLVRRAALAVSLFRFYKCEPPYVIAFTERGTSAIDACHFMRCAQDHPLYAQWSAQISMQISMLCQAACSDGKHGIASCCRLRR